MSAQVLMNLLNKLRKMDEIRDLLCILSLFYNEFKANLACYPFSSTYLINSIIQEHKYEILFIT